MKYAKDQVFKCHDEGMPLKCRNTAGPSRKQRLQLSSTLPDVPKNSYQEQSILGSTPQTEYDRKSKTVEHIPRPDGYNQG
jgi:hypothetical protein